MISNHFTVHAVQIFIGREGGMALLGHNEAPPVSESAVHGRGTSAWVVEEATEQMGGEARQAPLRPPPHPGALHTRRQAPCHPPRHRAADRSSRAVYPVPPLRARLLPHPRCRRRAAIAATLPLNLLAGDAATTISPLLWLQLLSPSPTHGEKGTTIFFHFY